MSEIGNYIEANAETPLAAMPTPRLRISHLMLWTLCCAVDWAMIRVVNAISTTRTVPELLRSMVTGAVFAGVITLISARVRGEPPVLKQPGHWLLFISAIFTSIGHPVVFLVARSLAVANPAPGPGSWQYVTLQVLYLFPPIAFAFAALRIRDCRWKILFVAMFLVDLPKFLYFLGIESPLANFGQWAKFVLAAAMVVVAIVETKTGPRRGWLHWTGVATHLASWSNQILRTLA